MKINKSTKGNVVHFEFIAEDRREQLLLGDLRHHYFYGDDKDGTFPEYDGITSEHDAVTSIKFKYNLFGG